MSAKRETWVIATGNPGKQREIAQILANCPIDFAPLSSFAPVDFPDEGTDYEANAIAKARAVAEQIGQNAVADDSGLEVEALDWGPGPLSARYGGEGLSDVARVDKLLAALRDVETGKRGARFVCIAALATPSGEVRVARGDCPGQIILAPTGAGGFGYDPVFRPDGQSKTFAELSSETKHRISHRALAFRKLWQSRTS